MSWTSFAVPAVLAIIVLLAVDRYMRAHGDPGILREMFSSAAGSAPKQPAADEVPGYCLRDHLFSQAEQAFYHTLCRVIGDHALVLGKVNLGDVICAASGSKKARYSAWQRINRKHLDYLLVDPRTLQPLAAIELDDRSHLRADRRARDAFLSQALSQADLPLYRFRPGSGTDADMVRAKLASLWRADPIVDEAPAPDASDPLGAEPIAVMVRAKAANKRQDR